MATLLDLIWSGGNKYFSENPKEKTRQPCQETARRANHQTEPFNPRRESARLQRLTEHYLTSFQRHVRSPYDHEFQPSEVSIHEFSDLSSETENWFHSYLRRSMSKQRVAMLPSKAQQQAIEAKLNFALGAETYDRLFLGFICGDVDNDTVDIFVQNEDTAAIVCIGYSWHVAVVVESVMKKPVKCVNVLPKNLSQTR